MSRRRLLSALLVTTLVLPALASSHREAPGILKRPMVDGTDFYMFRSYESGRAGYVTLIANFNPLQDPYGGPNYFPLDPEADYIFNVDQDGDCLEDLRFQFEFDQTSPFIALAVGDAGATRNVAIPLSNAGQITADDDSALNVDRTYRVTVFRGRGGSQVRGKVRDAQTRSPIFRMPFDNIGTKSMPDYETYARQFIHEVTVPGCSQTGRVFVGQRKESFAVNLGEVFDLVNVSNPLGDPAAEASDTADKNITTLALELPIACLAGETQTLSPRDVTVAKTADSTIAAWATARLPNATLLERDPDYNATDRRLTSGVTAQVSRLGHPLVNEVVIGLPDKDRFNASHPRNDARFVDYVSHPTLPELLEILFGGAGVRAPDLFPREDLIAVFLTGVEGLNRNGGVCEVLRLNHAIEPKPAADQENLGVLAGDLAGFPNGRRPGDDTVDIALRAVMGALLPEDVAPSGQLPFTDGAAQSALQFDETFPYLTTPLPGSPNETP